VKIYVDIDETICSSPGSRDYSEAVPHMDRISRINRLYDQGHEIVYWTARGTVTGIDWTEVTKAQFERWGVKCHGLKFQKPAYDLFIDDKNINSDRFFETDAGEKAIPGGED
jgi:CMP-N,N'-diacetyllegionaminic acid synthase